MRAQSVLEYLVIVSLVLIITAAVTFVMLDFPSIISQKERLEDNTAWSRAPLALRSFVYNDTTSVITFVNTERTLLNITRVFINNEEYTLSELSIPSGSCGQLKVLDNSYTDIDIKFEVATSYAATNLSMKGIEYHANEETTLIIEFLADENAGEKIMILINSIGDVTAMIYENGALYLAGSCYDFQDCSNPTDDSLIFQNSAGSTVGYINSSGDMCVEQGYCIPFNTCNNPNDGAFIVQNASESTFYVNATGGLCMQGDFGERIWYNTPINDCVIAELILD